MPISAPLFFGLALATAALAQDPSLRPLSLRDALREAQEHNPQALAADAAVRQAEGEMATARGRLLPEATLNARVTRIDEPIVLDLDPIRDAMIALHSPPMGSIPAANLDAALPHFQSTVQNELYYNATASVTWPIFAGGRLWASYQAASQNIEARKADRDAARNSVAIEVCSRYLGLRLASELVTLRDQTRATLQTHVENARRLEAGGQIAMAERLRAEVALAEAERDLDDAMRDQSMARLALANSLSGDTLITATTPLDSVHAPASLAELQAKAQSNHPGLRRLTIEDKRAGHGIDAARGEWMPVISLFGKRELYTDDLTLFEPTWAVGANLQWNLFSGGQSYGKNVSAKATRRELAEKTAKAKSDIALLVEKRWRELEHANGRLSSLAKTNELAEESLRAQQKAFEAGLGTSLDVVDAQLSLARVRVARLKAQFDADMALAGLLEATGEPDKIADILEDAP